jgi:hypothetical protein
VTLHTYTQAVAKEKRTAQEAVVALLSRQKHQNDEERRWFSPKLVPIFVHAKIRRG